MTHSAFHPRPFVAALAIVLFGFAPASLVAQTALTSWTSAAGSSSNLNSGSPILGNGTAGSTEGAVVYSTFASDTLANVGDSILFNGTISFTEAAAIGGGQFRFGLQSTNGQAGTTGWLGYWAGNSSLISGTDTAGTLVELVNPNTTSFSSGSVGTTTDASTTANSAFGSGTYTFSLKYQKQSATSLLVTWTLSNSSTYSLSGSYLDTSVATFTFNSAFVDTAGGFNSTQASLSNLSITAAPEPASLALFGLAGLTLASLRRKALFAAR